MKMFLSGCLHPSYTKCARDWKKYRNIWEGGDTFKQAYLYKHSKREEQNDYAFRKKITPVPGHARSTVLEIRNAIYQRLSDIKRNSTSSLYNTLSSGESGGVDRKSSSMTKFMGKEVLTELLCVGKVGVLVDAPRAKEGQTITKANEELPYATIFKVEDIRSWTYDKGVLTNLLLQEVSDDICPTTGLTNGESKQYLHYSLESGSVKLRIYGEKSQFSDKYEEITLDLPEIPFHILDLGRSLLCDIADHQIALLNLGSLDMSFSIKANFPFLTEQSDFRAEQTYLANSADTYTDNKSGSEANATENKNQEVAVGHSRGRRYGKNLDRPGFIHPSSEPMKASMKKQEDIKKDIRELALLAVIGLSDEADNQGLEAGLSFIGLTLEHAERIIARFFTSFESTDQKTQVVYPTQYSLRSDKDRREEAKELYDLIERTASLTARKSLMKKGLRVLLEEDTDANLFSTMLGEVDEAEVLGAVPEDLRKDAELGLVDLETASKARLYPKGSVKKAKKDHAERIARIQIAQTSATMNADARGIPDLADSKGGATAEKEEASNPDTDDKASKNQRGAAK